MTKNNNIMSHEQFFSHLVLVLQAGMEDERKESKEVLARHVFGPDYYDKATGSRQNNMQLAVEFIAHRGHELFKAIAALLKAGHKPRETQKNYARTLQDTELAFQAITWSQSR